MNFFDNLKFLGSPADELGWVATVVNFIAAGILAYALIVPYLETKRTKATFALGDDFFQKFVFGNILFIINAIFSAAENGVGIKDTKLYYVFAIFIVVNSLGLYLNSSILKMKRANMKAAEEKGMSEQEYWEKYLKNS